MPLWVNYSSNALQPFIIKPAHSLLAHVHESGALAPGTILIKPQRADLKPANTAPAHNFLRENFTIGLLLPIGSWDLLQVLLANIHLSLGLDAFIKLLT